MAKRQLFEVSTPLGYRVGLTRDRWREIVRFKHPAMAGKEIQIRTCLESPEIICESAKDPEVHVYYLQSGRAYICVVVAPGDESKRFIVTAYMASRLKQGKVLWTK